MLKGLSIPVVITIVIVYTIIIPTGIIAYAWENNFHAKKIIRPAVKGIAITALPTAIPVLYPAPTVVPSMPLAPVLKADDTQDTYLLHALNTYRVEKGLPIVTSRTDVCSFAHTRAIEVAINFSHNGFNNRVTSKSVPYKTYTLITENIAEVADYTQVIRMWSNSPGHAANMQKNTAIVCIAHAGNYYVMEGLQE